ncbi:hypothetical protein ACOSQ2_021010 [Xanthoceras sorbifolium]
MEKLRKGLARANQELAQGEERYRYERVVVTDKADLNLLYSIWLHHPNLPLSFLGEGLPAMIRTLGTGMMAKVETSCLVGSKASLSKVMVKFNHPSQQVLSV